MTVDRPDKRFHDAQNPSRLRRSCRRKTLRPEILDPEQDRRPPEFLQHDRRNSHRDRRRLEDQYRVVRSTTSPSAKDACEKGKRTEVEQESKRPSVPPRNERHTQDPDSMIPLFHPRQKSVAWEKPAVWIIRLSSKDRHLMSSFLQTERHIVDSEVFRPKILGDDEHVHGILIPRAAGLQMHRSTGSEYSSQVRGETV